jgi:hypothetical protein
MKAGSRRNRGIPTRGERGIALVIALWVMALLSLLGGVFLTLSGTESTISSNEIQTASAFNIAEAGLERAKRALMGADLNGVLANGGTLSFGSSVVFAGGTYQVVVGNNCTAIGNYAADTTGCPPPSTADGDNLVIVTSTGTYPTAGSAQSVLRLLLEVPAVTTPRAPLYMLPGFDPDPSHDNVNFTFQTPTFFVSGNDTNLDGTAGAGSGVYGAAVPPDARSDLVAEATPHAAEITGSGGLPSISTTASSPLTKASLCAARSELIPLATQTYTTGTTVGNGELLGTVASPQITYAQQDLTLGGMGANAVKGVGVLIVDGSLKLVGNSVFSGIIILCGQGEIEMSGGAKVYGAVLGANTGAYPGNLGETRFSIVGNAEVYFSRQALELASRMIPSKPRAWWEVRP